MSVLQCGRENQLFFGQQQIDISKFSSMSPRGDRRWLRRRRRDASTRAAERRAAIIIMLDADVYVSFDFQIVSIYLQQLRNDYPLCFVALGLHECNCLQRHCSRRADAVESCLFTLITIYSRIT